MSRGSFCLVLGTLLLVTAAATHGGSSTTEPFIFQTTNGVRGLSSEVDGREYYARLLAHFGEVALAYDVLTVPPRGKRTGQANLLEARLLTELGLTLRADSLWALQPETSDEQSRYLRALWRARLRLVAGDLEGALKLLPPIDAVSVPLFDSHRDYLVLECLVGTQQFEMAVKVGEQRLTLGVPQSLSPRFEELLLEAYVRAEAYEQALEFIDLVKARRSRSSRMAPVLMGEVDVLFATGDTLAAIERGVALLRDRRTSKHAAVITRSVYDRSTPAKLSTKVLIALCLPLVAAGDLDEAAVIIEVLKRRELSPAYTEQLAILRAERYFKKKHYNKAYALIRGSFADASLERTATLLRARIYRRTGQVRRAADEYVEFARKYPYDAKASEALLVASSLHRRLGDWESSLELLEMIVEIYPSSSHGRTAIRRLARYHLDRNNYDKAVGVLTEAVERSRRTNEELLYYLADAYDRKGDALAAEGIYGELQDLDPLSFYLGPAVEGLVAQPLLGSNGRVELYGDRGLLEFLERVFAERDRAYENVRGVLDEPPDAGQPELVQAREYLDRGRRFLEMGLRDWGEAELRVLETRFRLPQRYWFELGVLYEDFAMHWRSVRAFQRVYYSVAVEVREALGADFRLLSHPLPYPAVIIENASRTDVPPHLVYAMMRQESLFDRNAVSVAGAMGLMQLMPATGDQVAGQLGFPRGGYDRLFVPEINLTFGIWYASHLLARTEGDFLMMLSAYNAGLGNARRWFRGDEAAVVAMVDGIDYGETRNYVKRIVESARVYHRFYFNGSATERDPSH